MDGARQALRAEKKEKLPIGFHRFGEFLEISVILGECKIAVPFTLESQRTETLGHALLQLASEGNSC